MWSVVDVNFHKLSANSFHLFKNNNNGRKCKNKKFHVFIHFILNYIFCVVFGVLKIIKVRLNKDNPKIINIYIRNTYISNVFHGFFLDSANILRNF